VATGCTQPTIEAFSSSPSEQPWQVAQSNHRIMLELDAGDVSGEPLEHIAVPLFFTDRFTEGDLFPRSVTDDAGEPLPFEVECWEPGCKVLWVGLGQTTPGVSVRMWAYFGERGLTGAPSQETVFVRERYLSVHHFSEREGDAGRFEDRAELELHALDYRSEGELPEPEVDAPIGKGVRLEPGTELSFEEAEALGTARGTVRHYELWIRSDDLRPSSDQVILSMTPNPCNALMFLSGSKLSAWMPKANGCAGLSNQDALEFDAPDGTFFRWSHVVLSLDREQARGRLFVNGALVDQIDGLSDRYSFVSTMPGGMSFGSESLERNSGVRDPFVGAIDEFRVSYGELSAQRVRWEWRAARDEVIRYGELEANSPLRTSR